MAVFVLERRGKAGRHLRGPWTQYAFCARRRPLERVLEGLGGTKEWRIRRASETSKPVDAAA